MKYITIICIFLLSYGISFAQETKTPSGIIAKIENYNVVLYKNNKKIDTLTTKWNANFGDNTGIISIPLVQYTVLWVDDGILFIKKSVNDGMSGRDTYGYYRANLESKSIKLTNITNKVWKKLWLDARISKNDTGKWISTLYIWRDDPLVIANAKKNGYKLSRRASDDHELDADTYTRSISSLKSLGL